MQIENVPLPGRSVAQIESVPMPGRPAKPKKQKKVGAVKVTDRIKKAAKEYKEAYRDLYGLNPRLTFDGKWIRLAGEPQGMSLERLKERTKQLRNRKG